MGIIKTAFDVTAGVVTLNIVKNSFRGVKMPKFNRRGHMRKVKGRGAKVRIKGHRVKKKYK